VTESLRVLVVDDSPLNRQRITQMIETAGVGQVVAVARDGAEALARVQQFRPDVVTLDLEMPKVDGFAFLRLLMSVAPTPVIVVSSYSAKENVFRALEFGALDFVPKMDASADDVFRALLLEKLGLVRAVRTPLLFSLSGNRPPVEVKNQLSHKRRSAQGVVVIGASTGGPSALTEIVANLQPSQRFGVLIAQHMPAGFTRTFAQRLNRYSLLDVQEAVDDQIVAPGTALVCPGNYCMEVVCGEDAVIRVRVVPPRTGERYVPSVDRLFLSSAEALGARTIAVVVTGMGDDGAAGALAISNVGGSVVTEAESTAVVYGMPRAAALAVGNSIQVPLGQIAPQVQQLMADRESDSNPAQRR
jgi:two-component system, chemotaxis family, protein-glutamate methylesterase/glutaminase